MAAQADLQVARCRPGGRDAEEPFDVAAGEEGPVELFELADGVGDGEEPPGLGGTLDQILVNPLRSCGLGRFPAHMSLDMLVEGFTECKIRVPSF